MIAITRVLCPVDSSEFSRRALRHAAALAQWYRAQVTVLSVRPRLLPSALWLDEYPGPLPAEGPEERERAERAVRAFVQETVGQAVAQVEISDGSVVLEILRTASELPADLIVMGTHGVGGFDRLLLGSVTEKVLRKSPCPVLTVPKHATDADTAPAVTFKTILCAVDFSPAARRALDFALSLAQGARGHLVILHALEAFDEDESKVSAHFNVAEFRRMREQDVRQQLEQLVPEEARASCDPELVVGHGKAYREVLRIAGERDVHLIVLGVQGRSALDLTLFGSTTQHVLRSATCPVLTVGIVPPAA